MELDAQGVSFSTDEGLRMGPEFFLLAARECQQGFGALLSNTHSTGRAGVCGCGIEEHVFVCVWMESTPWHISGGGVSCGISSPVHHLSHPQHTTQKTLIRVTCQME